MSAMMKDLRALKARMERGLAMRFLDGAAVERAIEALDAQAEQIATLTRDLASAKARCERMEKAIRVARMMLADIADPKKLADRLVMPGTEWKSAQRHAASLVATIDAALADETSST